jgi:TrpR-related protein YerC/YecD
MKKPVEALALIKDLLSPQEAEMLAKRIKIAQLLIAGFSYSEIEHNIKVAPGTIARVNEWLKYGGDGYRLVVDRLNQLDLKSGFVSRSEEFDWFSLRRRYPIMFWPEILLGDIISAASIRKKQQLRKTIEEMNKKSKIYKQVDRALRKNGGF